MDQQPKPPEKTAPGLFERLGCEPTYFSEAIQKQEAALESWKRTHFQKVENALSAELASAQ